MGGSMGHVGDRRVGGRDVKSRLADRQDRWTFLTVLILLLGVALLRGPGLLSAWYNNLASLALAVEWPRVHQTSVLSACRQWLTESSAASSVNSALNLDPGSERARFNDGRVAWLLGDCEAALQSWSGLSNDDTMARLDYASGLYAMGREQEALEQYRQLEGAAEYVGMAGKRASASGDWSAAIQLYELSMSIAPTRVAAQALVELYLESGQEQAAAAVWRHMAAATDESNPDHWWAQGSLAEWSEDWDGAASAFERGAALSDAPCDFYWQQAANLERLQAWDQAEGVYLIGLDICPGQAWPYLELGSLAHQKGDDIGALQWYGQAESLWPERPEPKYYMGLIYYRQADYPRAQSLFQQALALDPTHHWSAYYLAWCFHRSGDPTRAVSALSRAIDLHPGEPWRWAVELGDWQVELWDWEQAIAAYRQALQWRPGDEAIQGKLDRALEHSR
jgi:tetratricopeptide (TPR) repeat protein